MKGMIEIPVSNGELLDKISILEIKVMMGINEAQKELDLLKAYGNGLAFILSQNLKIQFDEMIIDFTFLQ